MGIIRTIKNHFNPFGEKPPSMRGVAEGRGEGWNNVARRTLSPKTVTTYSTNSSPRRQTGDYPHHARR